MLLSPLANTCSRPVRLSKLTKHFHNKNNSLQYEKQFTLLLSYTQRQIFCLYLTIDSSQDYLPRMMKYGIHSYILRSDYPRNVQKSN